MLTLYFINLKNGRFFLASQSKSTCHFQNENSKCLRVPYLILGAKKQETFSDFLLSKTLIFLYDKVKDDEIEITVFSRYIDKNTYLKVQYLPHTKYGAIVEIK